MCGVQCQWFSVQCAVCRVQHALCTVAGTKQSQPHIFLWPAFSPHILRDKYQIEMFIYPHRLSLPWHSLDQSKLKTNLNTVQSCNLLYFSGLRGGGRPDNGVSSPGDNQHLDYYDDQVDSVKFCNLLNRSLLCRMRTLGAALAAPLSKEPLAWGWAIPTPL